MGTAALRPTHSPLGPRAGEAHLLTEASMEVPLHLRHSDSVLWPLGTTDSCNDGIQVDPDHLARREEEESGITGTDSNLSTIF